MHVRDRILGLRRVPARLLRANPKNFRTHPRRQQEALRGILKEVGYADALSVHVVHGVLKLAYQLPAPPRRNKRSEMRIRLRRVGRQLRGPSSQLTHGGRLAR